MKRLTFEGNFCDIAMCGEVRGGSFCEDGDCSQRKTWERLKAIEDILCDSVGDNDPDAEDEYDLERLAAVYNQRVSMRDEVSQRFSLTAKIPLDRLRELVEADETLREFAEDVALQFGYRGTTPDGRAAYTAGGLSTLEWAWSLLGWPDPKPAPECECQEEGCHEWANGGRPTPDGYKWLCSRHYWAYEAREEALKAREQDGQLYP